MSDDTTLILACFGFAFLMLLFRAPFSMRTIRADLFRRVCHAPLAHLGSLMNRRAAHGRGSASPQGV
jgi:hypothetical protein